MSNPLAGEMDQLGRDARRLGISLSPRQLRLLGIYLDVLWEWSRKMNLTGASTRARVLEELILDSLVPHAHLPEARRLLDVGTGAGFPGIPLKICRPRMVLHLVESNSKKVSFLREVIRRTRLEEVDIFHGRMERVFTPAKKPGYPLVTARAVAPLGKMVSWCAPMLARGGLLVAFQGETVDAALNEARNEIDGRRLSVERIIPYTLPRKKGRRHILLLRRQGERIFDS